MTVSQLAVRSRLVILDTSHLATLTQDFVSSARGRRQAAQQFLSFLVNSGWLPLVCWHHVEELLQHQNEQVVRDRVRFLQALPLIAWIASSNKQAGVGSVVDILRAEVKAAFEVPTASLINVRDLARGSLLRVGAGYEAFSMLQDWRDLRGVLPAREKRSREIVAISRSKSTNIDETRVIDWLNVPLRATADSSARLQRLQTALADDIANHGDKRIPDAATLSGSFFEGIARDATRLFTDKANPALAVLLAQGLDMEDIGPDTTFAEIGNLVIFRQRLRLASEPLRAPWSDIKRIVTADRVPVALIESAMRSHSQDHPERKGSDLTDVHLLCLSPYADVTFVDKRTHENLLRARRNVPILSGLIGVVSKASDYRQIEQELKQQKPGIP